MQALQEEMDRAGRGVAVDDLVGAGRARLFGESCQSCLNWTATNAVLVRGETERFVSLSGGTAATGDDAEVGARLLERLRIELFRKLSVASPDRGQ
jgi:hypothetical protein